MTYCTSCHAASALPQSVTEGQAAALTCTETHTLSASCVHNLTGQQFYQLLVISGVATFQLLVALLETAAALVTSTIRGCQNITNGK